MNHLLGLTLLVLISRLLIGCCGALCVSQMGFEIHLAAGRTALEGGTLTICQSGTCSSGTPVWDDVPMSGWQHAGIGLAGGLSGRVTLAVTPDERATIEAEVWPKGDRDTDHYDVRFVDSHGTTLLDFSRDQRYDRHDLCGQSCTSGAIRVWPTSPNDLTCSSRTCDSGAGFTANVTLPDQSAQGTSFEICRNDVCAGTAWPRFTPGGNLSAGLSGRSLGGNEWEFSVWVTDDPAVLADGDRYRLTITPFQQSAAVTIDRPVTYAETWPNGSACDPFPCRWATIAP